MAKATNANTIAETQTDTKTPVAPSDESLDLAARAISAITGCGIHTALAKAGDLPVKQLDQIAALERDNKRDRIPAILAALPAKPQPSPKPAATKSK